LMLGGVAWLAWRRRRAYLDLGDLNAEAAT